MSSTFGFRGDQGWVGGRETSTSKNASGQTNNAPGDLRTKATAETPYWLAEGFTTAAEMRRSCLNWLEARNKLEGKRRGEAAAAKKRIKL